VFLEKPKFVSCLTIDLPSNHSQENRRETSVYVSVYLSIPLSNNTSSLFFSIFAFYRATDPLVAAFIFLRINVPSQARH
jgi:hypothetical protein